MAPRILGYSVLGLAVLLVVAGSFIAPNPPDRQFRDHLYAPPMRVHVVDEDGHLRAPFLYPVRVVDRANRTFVEDRTVRQPLVWFRGGSLVRVLNPQAGPLLVLGGDDLGRDVFSRLVLGTRASLGVAITAAFAALLVGGLCGGLAGSIGGWVDEILMRIADFTLVLPALYVVLVLRTVMPEVLSFGQVFLTMTGVFAVVGWPYVARGVRAVVLSEQRQVYTLAAKSVGVSRWRLLTRHLLPAARGVLGVQAGLLVPGFILAEASLSFVGLGFPNNAASWGAMLRSASNVYVLSDYPWLLSPAIAIVVVVLGINLSLRSSVGREPLQWITR